MRLIFIVVHDYEKVPTTKNFFMVHHVPVPLACPGNCTQYRKLSPFWKNTQVVPSFSVFEHHNCMPYNTCTSSSNVASATSGLGGFCVMLSNSSVSKSPWMLRSWVKYLLYLHVCCCDSGVVHLFPFLSITTAVVVGSMPLHPV